MATVQRRREREKKNYKYSQFPLLVINVRSFFSFVEWVCWVANLCCGVAQSDGNGARDAAEGSRSRTRKVWQGTQVPQRGKEDREEKMLKIEQRGSHCYLFRLVDLRNRFPRCGIKFCWTKPQWSFRLEISAVFFKVTFLMFLATTSSRCGGDVPKGSLGGAK